MKCPYLACMKKTIQLCLFVSKNLVFATNTFVFALHLWYHFSLFRLVCLCQKCLLFVTNEIPARGSCSSPPTFRPRARFMARLCSARPARPRAAAWPVQSSGSETASIINPCSLINNGLKFSPGLHWNRSLRDLDIFAKHNPGANYTIDCLIISIDYIFRPTVAVLILAHHSMYTRVVLVTWILTFSSSVVTLPVVQLRTQS